MNIQAHCSIVLSGVLERKVRGAIAAIHTGHIFHPCMIGDDEVDASHRKLSFTWKQASNLILQLPCVKSFPSSLVRGVII